MTKNKLIWLRDTFLRGIFSDIIDVINKNSELISTVLDVKTYINNKTIEIDVNVEKQISVLNKRIDDLELQIKNATKPKEDVVSVTKAKSSKAK